jgi:hypothetical protein
VSAAAGIGSLEGEAGPGPVRPTQVTRITGGQSESLPHALTTGNDQKGGALTYPDLLFIDQDQIWSYGRVREFLMRFLITEQGLTQQMAKNFRCADFTLAHTVVLDCPAPRACAY